MAITAVAKFDFPEHWPALMPALVSLLQGNGVPGDAEASARAVAGSLRCLSLLADEVDDTQVELYAPALLPELCAIANGSRGHGSEARRRAFSVLRTFIGTLGLMASQKENRAKAESLLAPTLPAWLAAMTAVLATPRADDGDHAAVALQLEVLRSLTALTMLFSKVIKAPDTQAALQAAWALLCGSARRSRRTPSCCARPGHARASFVSRFVHLRGRRLTRFACWATARCHQNWKFWVGGAAHRGSGWGRCARFIESHEPGNKPARLGASASQRLQHGLTSQRDARRAEGFVVPYAQHYRECHGDADGWQLPPHDGNVWCIQPFREVWIPASRDVSRDRDGDAWTWQRGCGSVVLPRRGCAGAR